MGRGCPVHPRHTEKLAQGARNLWKGGRPGRKDKGRGSRRGSLPPGSPSLLWHRRGGPGWEVGGAGAPGAEPRCPVPRLRGSPPGGRGAEPEDRGRGSAGPRRAGETLLAAPGTGTAGGESALGRGRDGSVAPAPGARPGGCWSPRARSAHECGSLLQHGHPRAPQPWTASPHSLDPSLPPSQWVQGVSRDERLEKEPRTAGRMERAGRAGRAPKG